MSRNAIEVAGPARRARPPGALRAAIHRAQGAGDLWPTVIGSAMVIGLVFAFWAFATAVTPDVWVPVVVLVGLLVVSIPICVWASGRPSDHRLLKILLLALLLKMGCTFPRYAVNEYLYAGEVDAANYFDGGRVVADNLRHGEWSLDGSYLDSFPQETRTVGYFAGVLFLVIGTSLMGGYLLFSWLGWLGLVFTFRAFRVAFPNAPPYLAAMLIFFVPSLLYWPSTIGKDALMLFAIGLMTLGIARLLTVERPLLGLLWASCGGALVLLVRPHLFAIALVGIAISLLARNDGVRRTRPAIAMRVLLLLLLVPALFAALGRIDDAFGDKSTGQVGAAQVLQDTGRRTAIGGSSFETNPVTNPLDVPTATFSVIFRPFVFEASSFPALVSAVEGGILLLLAVFSGRWLWRIGPAMYHHPFAAYCGGYVLAFVVAFSNIANAGILARQRVQMFPLLMILVAAAAEQYRLAVTDAPSAELPAMDLPVTRASAASLLVPSAS